MSRWLLDGISLGGMIATLPARARFGRSGQRQALRAQPTPALAEEPVATSEPAQAAESVALDPPAPVLTIALAPAQTEAPELSDAPTVFLGRVLTEEPTPMPASIADELLTPTRDELGEFVFATATKVEPLIWLELDAEFRSRRPRCPRCKRFLGGLLDACSNPACLKADLDFERLIDLGSES